MEKERLARIKEDATIRLKAFENRLKVVPPPTCKRITMSIDTLIEMQKDILELCEEVRNAMA